MPLPIAPPLLIECHSFCNFPIALSKGFARAVARLRAVAVTRLRAVFDMYARARLAAVCLVFLLAAPVGAAAGAGAPPSQRDVLAGPVEARVIRVGDGDTLVVGARIWVGQEIVIRARISGIDAPELRARCPRERALAQKARDFVVGLVGRGPVWLVDIRNGKYAGRVVAGVRTADGTDLGGALLKAGLARPYDGGKRKRWCGSNP